MARLIGRRDRIVAVLDSALRSLGSERPTGRPAAESAPRPSPASTVGDAPITPRERRLSAALMRVNRAGEISAQALYKGQAIFARDAGTRRHLLDAADEERDHLAWCTDRLAELGGRPSLLDPLWHAGSFLLGAAAGIAGDRASLGFVAETERQVEAHLEDHLARLPASDAKSRAILERMAEDESRHGHRATVAGGIEPREPVRTLMSMGGSLLRQTALLL
jgi:3-demethoxyubiquinol 3-hydroxylase